MTQEYAKIAKILQDANKFLQYPRIRLRKSYTLQLAGANSKYPNAVNITDGKPYGSNKWFGRISTGGTLSMPNHMQEYAEELQTELALFQLDPAKYAKGVSDLSGSCMFCGKTLNHPQSVAVGYGSTCAANYGLPWGDIDPEEAKKQASLEFDLPSGKEESIIAKAEAGISEKVKERIMKAGKAVGREGEWNAGKRLCGCGKFPPNMECNCQTESGSEDKLILEAAKFLCEKMLSNATQAELAHLIEFNKSDEYMLRITKLWEAL